jgi:hypothetical protein
LLTGIPIPGIQAVLNQSHLLVVVHSPHVLKRAPDGAPPLRQALACKRSAEIHAIGSAERY